MANQTSVNPGNGTPIHAPAHAMVSNVAEFGHDVATLAELQAQLALVDFKESAGKAAVPAVALGTGLALALGALPVLLTGLAELLVRYAGLAHSWALILTAGVVMALAGSALAFAAWRLKGSFVSFRRSRDELARNVAWVKTVLLYSGRPAPHQRRGS